MRELSQRMTKVATDLQNRIKKGESVNAAAASIYGQPVRATGLSRQAAAGNTALSRDLLAKLFAANNGDVLIADDVQFGLLVAKLEAIRAADGPQLAQMTEAARPQISLALFREMNEAAHRAARDKLKVRIDPNRARMALGLDPLPTPGQAEKKK